ncbi:MULTISPECIES: alternative ribosome rescue aminoacyl-tRNA hydrolase ArfB [unclassified Pseudofrankia]|uniref:alternative ribosome rescue aminoacyl-tRNA hydrolase ArfB n=1 Tax=unclassified Pseudofrankia TaxID=2994372 RepID=UPI000A4E4457|nr:MULTISPECIES: alternative ribosome rescue aminoacyl-tRNA hydrolase ArfB [unclassified Pseudofrankia]MDT3441281.1 alternative ribosome rescue aminoacyl-tRNA hydrolase ArfB [Pseudofrankia sp. BMG5.37]
MPEGPVARVPQERAARAVRPGFVLPETELRWRFSRSSGPGGQGVNTTDSRAEVRFDVARSPAIPEPLRERALARLAGRLVDGDLVVTSSEQRSQLRNREAALDRLVALLHDATAPPPRRRRPTKPTRGSVERRLDTKRRRSATKRTRRPGASDADG